MQIINYGMPTLIETSTVEECAKLCAELGLDFIELNMNLPQYQLDKITLLISTALLINTVSITLFTLTKI